MHFTQAPAAACAALCLASAAFAGAAQPASGPAPRAAVKAREQAIRDAAAADYRAARKGCDAKSGNDKDVCIKVAKAFLADARSAAAAKAKAGR